MITQSQVLKWLEATAAVIEENRQYLTDLDSPIGDADHGINMDRGFQKVLEKLPGLEGKDVGTVLKTVGMTLVYSVGGAGGPLYGTAVMQAGSLMLLLSLRLAAPILVAFLLMLVVLAIMARLVPEMNILFVSMPIRVGLGFLMGAMLLPFFQEYINEFATFMNRLLPV